MKTRGKAMKISFGLFSGAQSEIINTEEISRSSERFVVTQYAFYN